jgi:hypothetical protein
MTLLLPIVLTLLNLSLLPILMLLIRRAPLWAFYVFLPAVIAEGIFSALYTVIMFGGAFGPGILTFCASALMVPVIFVGWIIIGMRLFPRLDRTRRMVYSIGGIIILLAQAAPVIGNYGIGGYCDKKAREYGDEIVKAIHQFQKDNGIYPEKIESLVPDYLPSTPIYSCLSDLGLHADELVMDYQIKQCQGKLSLATKSTDGSRDVWYDFETGEWSSISFFDSGCY